jgi:hypothetical protein
MKEVEGRKKEERIQLFHQMDVFREYHLYETRTRFYLVATLSPSSSPSSSSSASLASYTVLKIDRTVEAELCLQQDPMVYSESQWRQTLHVLAERNKSCGGVCKWPQTIHGVVGFVHFLKGYYMILITRCSQVKYHAHYAVYN